MVGYFSPVYLLRGNLPCCNFFVVGYFLRGRFTILGGRAVFGDPRFLPQLHPITLIYTDDPTFGQSFYIRELHHTTVLSVSIVLPGPL